MPFSSITRESLELLNQNYRRAGVLPGAVPGGRGNEPAPADPSFRVADEFIRVLPFENALITGRPHARQYQVTVRGILEEPEFTARPGGSAWIPGQSSPSGNDFVAVGTRFKKLSLVVRSDESMVDGGGTDMLEAQIDLARTAIVRALSEALFHSSPPNDDGAELAGLPFYLGGGVNDVGYDSARGMMGGLAEIEARCSPGDGDFGARPDVFVMSSRARWRLLREMEEKGVTPQFDYSPITGRRQLHFHGLPVLIGRVPEPKTTDAWALKLYGPSGIRLVHLGGVEEDFGLRREERTTLAGLDGQGEANSATRSVEVFGVYSLSVPDPFSIARLNGIPAADPFTVP